MKIEIEYNADINELMNNKSFRGFTLQELGLARFLIENGISPRQIRRIQTNLAWAYEIIQKENERVWEQAFEDINNLYRRKK